MAITPVAAYDNPYEAAYQIYKGNQWFNRGDFDLMSKRGDVDLYFRMLSRSNELGDYNVQNREWALDYLPHNQRVQFMMNELFSDRTDETREMRYTESLKKDVIDTITDITDYYKAVEDKSNFEKKEIGEMNEYEYSAYLMKQYGASIFDEMYERMKNDLTTAQKVGRYFMTLPAMAIKFLGGAATGLDDFFGFIISGFQALGAGAQGENIDEAFRNAFKTGNGRLFDSMVKAFGGKGVQAEILNFERQYTMFARPDGTTTTYGKFLGGVSHSLGVAAPSMVMNAVLPGAGIPAKAVSAIASIQYFGSLFGGRVHEGINNPALDSVPTGIIVLNAGIQSGMDFLIARGLAKVMGPTIGHKLQFGWTGPMVKGATKSLTTHALAVIGKSALQSGMEEVAQEWSQHFVSYLFAQKQGWEAMNDGRWNMAQVYDAFLLGAISSLFQSAFSVTFGKYLSKTGRELKQLQAYQEANPLAAFAFRANYQTLIQNYAELVSDRFTTMDTQAQQNAVVEMYKAMRVISGIYGELGQARFEAAQSLIEQMQKTPASKVDTQTGKTQVSTTQQAAQIYLQTFNEMNFLYIPKKMQAELNRPEVKAKLTANESTVVKDAFEVVRNAKTGETSVIALAKERAVSETATKKAIKVGKQTGKNVLITENGRQIIDTGETIVMSQWVADNISPGKIYQNIAEQRLVQTLIADKGGLSDFIKTETLDAYRTVMNDKSATLEYAVYNLLFNQTFYNIMLGFNSSLIFDTLSQLHNISKSVLKTNIQEAIYAQTTDKVLQTIAAPVIQFLIGQETAQYMHFTFLTAEQKAKITQMRTQKTISAKLLRTGNLTSADQTALRNQINALPLEQAQKQILLNDLQLDHTGTITKELAQTRQRVLQTIDIQNKQAFLSDYNRLYLPMNTVQNAMFNEFMRQNGLTLETIGTEYIIPNLQQQIVDAYGTYNVQNKIDFLKNQFTTFNGDQFNFDVNENGKVTLTDSINFNVDAYINDYNKYVSELMRQNALTKMMGPDDLYMTDLLTDASVQTIIDGLLSNSLDSVSRGAASINDIIQNANTYLNDTLKQAIIKRYGNINSMSAFLFLRQYLASRSKGKNLTSLVLMSDGSVMLANLQPMMNYLIKATQNVEMNTKQLIEKYGDGQVYDIQEFMQSKYLVNLLADTKVTVQGESTYYDANRNVIFISKNSNTTNGAFLFSLLHEFQHAIQTMHTMNRGLSLDFIENLHQADAKRANAIVAEVQKMVPAMFTDQAILNLQKSNPNLANYTAAKLRRFVTAQFIYRSSGEIQANGFGNTIYANLYNTIVNAQAMQITLPNGTVFDITRGGMAQSESMLDITPQPDALNQFKVEDFETKQTRYVSKTQAEGTNLRYFTEKNVALQLSPDAQRFIVNADLSKLVSSLAELIAPPDGSKSTLTETGIMQWFRSTTQMNAYTFELLNKEFFQNEHITNSKTLMQVINNLGKFYALRALMRSESQMTQKLMTESLTVDQLLAWYDQIALNPEYSQKLQEIEARYADTKIDKKNARVTVMQQFDGTLYEVGSIASTMKFVEVNNWQKPKKMKGTVDTSDTAAGAISLSKGVYGTDGILISDTIEAQGAADFVNNIVLNNSVHQMAEALIAYEVAQRANELRKLGPEKARVEANKIRMTWEAKDAKDVTAAYVNYNLAQTFGLEMTIDALHAQTEIFKAKDAKVQAELNKQTVATRNRTVVAANLKRIGTTVSKHLSKAQYKNLPKEFQAMFDANTLTLKSSVYENVSLENLLKVEEQLRQLSKDVRSMAYISKASAKMTEALRSTTEANRLKSAVKQLNIGEVKTKIIEVQGRELRFNSEQAMPAYIEKLLKFFYESYSDSEVQFLTKEGNMQNMQMNMNKFFEVNADVLAEITTEPIKAAETIAWFENTILQANSNDIRKLIGARAYTLAQIIRAYNQGRLILDQQTIQQARNILQFNVSNAGLEMAVFNNILDIINPESKTVTKIMRDLDLYGDMTSEQLEALVKPLTEAIHKGDTKSIDTEYSKLYNELMQKYDNKKKPFMEKMMRFQKAMMLSGLTTIVRNQMSDVMVYYGGMAAEQVGRFLTMGRKYRAADYDARGNLIRDAQYNIAGTKTSDAVFNFIKETIGYKGFKNPGDFLTKIADGLSKYDARLLKPNAQGTDLVVQMIADSITAKIARKAGGFKHNIAWINQIVNGIWYLQSDQAWVNKQAMRYFGKMMTQDGTSTSEGLSPQVMQTLARAYQQANYDFMRKPNVFTKIETAMKKQSQTFYYGYKMVFPFMSAGWNWFMESLNWTPLGLVKGVTNLLRTEQNIMQAEASQQGMTTSDYIRMQDIQQQLIEFDAKKGNLSTDEAKQFTQLQAEFEVLKKKARAPRFTIDPRLVEHKARQTIGKGLIGTFMLGLGALMGGMGWITVDRKDDKLKLDIGGLKVDFSAVFGTSALLIGAEMVNPRKGNVGDVFKRIFNTTMDGMFLSDLVNTFRFGDTFADWMLKQPTTVLGMFWPNALKQLSRATYNHEVAYSKGFVGQLERLVVSMIPGLAHAFPKQINPYTGQPELKQRVPFILDFINMLSPIKFRLPAIGELEAEALGYGLNKGQLTAKYTINDESFEAKNKASVNQFYGKLNAKALTDFKNNKSKHRIQVTDKKGNTTYKIMTYSQMDNDQRARVWNSIMQSNAEMAKIYAWTSAGNKYYASGDQYLQLRQNGVNNVYKETNKSKGFA